MANFLPLTPRDMFFADPFFRSSWSEYDRLFEEMRRHTNAEFWNMADQEIKHMGHLTHDKGEGKGKEVANTDDESLGVFPRRWMMPRLFGQDDAGIAKALDLFQNNNDHHEVRVHNDDHKFELSLDTHGFKPEEIKVNVDGNVLGIEAHHEEKSEGKMIRKNYSRHYTMPQTCEKDKVTCNLSSDGILVITAPKNPALGNTDAAIPVSYEK